MFVLEHGRGLAAYNMAFDEALLEGLARIGRPVLRFYGWSEPAASFGYFQRYKQVSQLTALRPLVRRPTAGGLVPHDADWTYSLVFPAGSSWYQLSAVESYRKVHEWIQAAFARLGVPTEVACEPRRAAPGQCFVGNEKFDLLWQGRKVAGAAQRRTRDGLLIQGSAQPPPIGLNKPSWQKAMCDVIREQYAVTWQQLSPDAELESRVALLQEQKYSRASHNEKR